MRKTIKVLLYRFKLLKQDIILVHEITVLERLSKSQKILKNLMTLHKEKKYTIKHVLNPITRNIDFQVIRIRNQLK